MIDRTEKICISEFEKVIQVDSSSREYARFPTRFILVESLGDWISVLETLKRFAENTINLSEFCKNDQSPPDVRIAVEKAIEKVKKGKKVLFVPFSEYMRFFPNYKDFLAELSNFQIDPQQNGRLYVPLLFSKTKFQEFWDDIPSSEFQSRRRPAIEIIPSEVRDLEVYVTNIEDISEFSQITEHCQSYKSYQDYLKFFEGTFLPEQMIKKPRIMFISDIIPQILKKLEDPTVKKIENYKSFLEHILYVKTPIPYKKEEDIYWKKLAKELLSRKVHNFEEFLKSYFNVAEFRFDIFENWKKLDDFKKWLLFNWGKVKIQENAELSKKYLGQVLISCESFEELERQIWLKIFDIEEPKTEIFEERRKIIENLSLNPPREFLEKVYEIKEPEKRIKFLTPTSFEERKELLKNFAELIKSQKALEEVLPLIENSYPELYYYLTFPLVESEYDLVQEYFKWYKVAKITDDFDDYAFRLYQIAERINFFEIKPRNEIIEKIEGKKVFIDGLGLEWLGFIYHLMKKRGYIINYLYIARSAIPTTSEFNKAPEESVQLKEMDSIYHRQDLDYPDYLIEEIDTLKEELNKVEKLVEEYGSVILTSDHGSTRFSGWPQERIDLTLEFEIERNGRYAKTKVIPPGNPEYEIELINGQYFLISKTHKVFKGGRKTKVENHGGTTLEEALIPVIVISKHKQKRRKITLLDKEISILNPVFIIEVVPPSVRDPVVMVAGRKFEASKLKEGVWKIDLSPANLKPGAIKAEIRIDEEVQEFEIKIKGGMEEEELI